MQIKLNIVTLLALFSVAKLVVAQNSITSAKVILSTSSRLATNFVAGDNFGITYYIGSAATTQIDSEQISYNTGLNCDGAELQATTLTNGGFNFTSGNTYYQDANGLYSLAINLGVRPDQINSAQIAVVNSFGPSLTYCVPTLVCDSVSSQCTTTDTDFALANNLWDFRPG